MKSLFAKTGNSIFVLFLCFIGLVSCILLLFFNLLIVQINCNVQWKKYDFWELLKTELSVFANELFIYCIYN